MITSPSSHQLREGGAEAREDERTEKREEDAKSDLRGDHVLRRPLRHLKGVRRLRCDNEHADERRDEGEALPRRRALGSNIYNREQLFFSCFLAV